MDLRISKWLKLSTSALCVYLIICNLHDQISIRYWIKNISSEFQKYLWEHLYCAYIFEETQTAQLKLSQNVLEEFVNTPINHFLTCLKPI